MIDDVQNKWEKFLNPDELKPYLLFCSLFITCYEMLKETFIERLVVFYTEGFDESGFKTGSDYKEKVLSLDDKKRHLQASINWHIQNAIIDENDVKAFNRITECRNTITHRLLSSYVESLNEDLGHIFNDIVNLIYKVEKWWIINFELEIQQIEDADEIDYEGIMPGAIMTIKLLVDIALGDKEESEFYYKEFIKVYKKE
ncbi:MAG: hypothetical protein Q8J62_05705 [Candidatus Cloacimonadaceae bacterium]|nr:hypothetical protein [Candidatus Cloacimonadaceae bacterium]